MTALLLLYLQDIGLYLLQLLPSCWLPWDVCFLKGVVSDFVLLCLCCFGFRGYWQSQIMLLLLTRPVSFPWHWSQARIWRWCQVRRAEPWYHNHCRWWRRQRCVIWRLNTFGVHTHLSTFRGFAWCTCHCSAGSRAAKSGLWTWGVRHVAVQTSSLDLQA